MGITSNTKVIFIPLIAFIPLEHPKTFENKDLCDSVMPSEDTKMSEFN